MKHLARSRFVPCGFPHIARRAAWLLGLFLVLTGCRADGAAVSAPSDAKGAEAFRALWTVSAVYRAPECSMSEAEIAGMLFKPLDMDGGYIAFDGAGCEAGDVRQDHGNIAGAFGEISAALPPELLKAGLDATLVRTECHLPGFSEYIRLRDGRLVVLMRGAFLVFEPNRSF